MQKNKVRIKLKGFDAKIVDQSVMKIIEAVKNSGAEVSGPVMLPTEKDIYCVQRCTTIDKESMEHFETRTHKRLVDIKKPTSKTMEQLTKLDLPSGVDIEIKA
ncbi:MAG: 30S ribosomal protein S10 [Armatimonadetes bacterium]|nr:30S ribosomal protein S10 [Candidatus Hippobium faecium]